jgi:hypothetical protein
MLLFNAPWIGSPRMTSEMIVRDCIVGTGLIALALLVLVIAGVPAVTLKVAGGVGVGFYLFAVWVAIRYE